ncbi:MAG TPA: hypothetical protein VG125_04495 [Pirellulales bacterium]|jgi:hypothetical protein|nr:hypothetical protein [Pirellulales bacterium]
MAGKKLAPPPRGGSDIWKDHDPPIKTGPIDHRSALDSVRWLTRTQYKMHRPDAMQVEPNELIRVLNEAGVKFVLMGQHGISGWLSEPRATRDVDVVVQKRHHGKAIKAIQAAWPELVIKEYSVVTRFLDPANNEPVVDVMRPNDVYREAFKNCVRVGDTHNVPNLELALAAKFAAMVSRNREIAKKYLDASDFTQMALRNRARINVERLRELGDAVYPDGGQELERFVDDVLAGRRLRL